MTDEQDKAVGYLPPRNSVLDSLVEMGDAISLPVVLSVNGIIVSGSISNASKWFGVLGSADESETAEPAVANSLREMFQRLSEETKPTFPPSEQDSLERREFIYLEDVCIFIGSNKIKTPLWCARLDDVDGFTLGIPGL